MLDAEREYLPAKKMAQALQSILCWRAISLGAAHTLLSYQNSSFCQPGFIGFEE